MQLTDTKIISSLGTFNRNAFQKWMSDNEKTPKSWDEYYGHEHTVIRDLREFRNSKPTQFKIIKK